MVTGNRELMCNVVDAPCGAGKTSAAINFINSSPEESRFLFVTPFLDEASRIKASCPGRCFEQPDYIQSGSKFMDIKRLFRKGANIVSTHALFRKFDAEILRYISDNHYTLIMDEVTSVLEPMKITRSDRDLLTDTCVRINEENGQIIWDNDGYINGKLQAYKNLCLNRRVVTYDGLTWLWVFPIETFTAFKDIYILTYMFDAQIQKCYYDYYGLQYRYLNVRKEIVDGDARYSFTTDHVNYHTEAYKSLIDIVESEKLNSIGADKYDLSVGWYEKAAPEDFKRLKRNSYNFIRNIAHAKSKECLWTTFKKNRECIEQKGFTRSFISISARSTNKYADRKAAAYLANKFVNPHIKNFFQNQGIEFDEDKYALSELIQWIWRTRIRNGEPIALYIPSSRMRGLLKTWLEGEKINNL